ncbi:hypothetical protein ASPWEDRAFT_35953 [Aspergillus wentii DTO 134E9]|uniref:IgE-binding protein n=1 Tax=Aspergillus wentii DTO 134E9 TaxID=1073089 RepID=A0A1L9RTT5_ASPWE|nr:uncharacterized protein ASPWEDRAFT_35953 [Aspergillus wentii DTO 134E9]KAI9933976.1 hypothetical protein MW887_005048 [Aspergillus wentii]OJJ38340.1 hypothetical protein ASPWEDRAFT_35953 [Aspergillus wentii DTO 134E9]
MKFSLLTLLPLAAALPTAEKRASSSFGVMSARSGSEIHLLPMNAANGSFWLGEKANTYCPEAVEQAGGVCPTVQGTSFSSATSLDVIVPGGQAVYVDGKGALRFTVPHSAAMAPGASTGPFTYTPGTKANPIGHYTFTGQGASGFMACPVVDGDHKKWQVFAGRQNATVPSGNVADCLGFDAMAVKATSNSTAAWEFI